MKWSKKFSAAVTAVIMMAAVLIRGLGGALPLVQAGERLEPTGDLRNYAAAVVGTTDQGWTIKSSVDPTEADNRAIGNAGVKVSKVYGGYTSYTEILSVVSDDGRSSIAYCVQPELNTPNNTDYRQQVMNNDRLRTVLYYGYGGNDSAAFMALERNNVNNAYMDTWMAVRIAYNGGASQAAANDPMVQWLLNHAGAPATRFEVGESPQTAVWNPDAMRQETGWYTTSGGGTFSLNLEGTGLTAELSDGSIINANTGGIAAGTSFRLMAGPEKNGAVDLEIPTTATGYAGMIFVPSVDPSRQSIVAGYGGDPAGPGRIQARFSRCEEESQVVKLDIETGENAQGDARLDGATFGLYTPDGGKLAEGVVANGVLTFPAQLCGDYYIQEISAGEGYLLNDTKYTLHLKEPGTTAVVKAKNRVKKGTVKLKKLAVPNEEQNEPISGTLNPLAGAEFTLTLKSNKQIKYVKTTGSDGQATFENVPYGVYTLAETRTPEGYIGGAIEDEVTIGEDGQVLEYFFGNKDFYADLTVVKKDSEDGNPVALSGASFRIYDVQAQKFVVQYPASHLFLPVSEWRTDNQGKLGLDKPLKAGDYILVETQAPVGYLTYDGTDGAVRFTADGREYWGIPFTLNAGNCTLVETPAKSYYAYEQALADAPAKGRIRIEKTGEMTDGTVDQETPYGILTTFKFSQKAMAGAVFEIYADEDIVGASDGSGPRIYHRAGDKVAEITTGADGAAISEDLYLGKYRVVEKSAPDGFVPSDKNYKVALTYKGQTISAGDNVCVVKIENAKQKAVFTLEKSEEVLEEYRVGPDGTLEMIKNKAPAEGITFGVFTGKPIADGRGGMVPADRLVSIGTVENGTTATTENFPAGDYYYRELATKGNLVLDTSRYPITYVPEGNAPVITLRAANGEAIVNRLFTKAYTLLKTEGRGGAPLSGATFGFYDAEKNLIYTQKTDGSGKITIPALTVGTYYYRELAAPEGYIRDKRWYSFEVAQDGKILQGQVENNLAMGTLSIEKTGDDLKHWQVADGQAVYKATAIAGADFAVRAKADIVTADGVLRAKKGDTVAHLVTGGDGSTALTSAWFMTAEAPQRPENRPVDLTQMNSEDADEIPVAKETALFNAVYEVAEVAAPEGWTLDETVYEADLRYADDETPLVTIETIKPFDRAVQGDATLSKTDISTGEAIPGTRISLYTEDGTEIYTGLSDEAGKITVKKLPAGDYYFKESGAAKGYVLDDTPVRFTINSDGAVVKCQMTNRKAENPGTGTDGESAGPFLAGCIVLMLGAAAGVGIYQKKKMEK